MTNKQKIIDGVDVSGCEFYNKVIGEDGYCNIDEEHLCTCISYDNCHYKLYKRKEQKCEEWKHQAELGSDTTDRLAKQLEEKEQELDECREKFHKQLDQLKASNEELQEKIKAYDEVYSNHDVLNERNNYKQALQEIKSFVANEMIPDENTYIILEKCKVLDETLLEDKDD